ncbi:MAG: NADH-quinone oxidoreductase subunit C [Mycobacterium sp.]|uniref:hydrogenase large subunit n=1 Tax=Mycobacterium sp. TaxID=1785 RepID=UPI002602A5C9|nr:NADH-quinone oxidoreductase subunit C [Mycobacterium sp.]MDI3314568.1 NADH-quinone oxidoreductase subunit C [Mycobacterium sp.]
MTTIAGTHRSVIELGPEQLSATAGQLLADGYRLALVAAQHDDGDALRVVYLLTSGPPDSRIELHIRLDPHRPQLPSLAALSFPASRFEREMHDLYGVIPLDHPQPRRLVRHHHWPRGWYPMRADTGPPPEFGDPEGPYPFLTVEGPGVYEIPVGPVHAGLIEPGHFRFSVVGETILKLKARLWFVHKGVERLFQSRDIADALALAERVSGDTTVGHALAYCLAVEDATGWPVPPQAQRKRAILLELERLYNHTTDIGALCNDVGHGILHAHALRIREQLLRLNAEITGHRLLRGGVIPGGAHLRTLPDTGRLRAIAADIAEIVHLALGHSVVTDRFTATAILSRDAARDLGTLGYVARASGLPVDARHQHPFHDGGGAFTPVTRDTGDVLARFLVRADEIAASAALITALTPTVTAGTTRTEPPTGATARAVSGVGIVEGWRGTITHRVELAFDHTLTRNKIVDPSFFNWPALPIALSGAIVPDFPLVNKSFNLSYAGNDL